MANHDMNPESGVDSAEEGVVAVRRAMRILEAFGVEDAHLSLAEPSRRTGCHRSTVWRLARTLALEPRHWGALTQLGAMLEETGADDRALAAWRQSLEINPHQPEAQDGVARLTARQTGQDV